jgi:hypothetical protein
MGPLLNRTRHPFWDFLSLVSIAQSAFEYAGSSLTSLVLEKQTQHFAIPLRYHMIQ